MGLFAGRKITIIIIVVIITIITTNTPLARFLIAIIFINTVLIGIVTDRGLGLQYSFPHRRVW